MSITVGESTFPERARQGGLIDDVGGVATVILAIFGFIGLQAPIMAVIATIVFGITLLIQGNGMMSEYARFSVLLGGKSSINGFAASSRSAVILLGGRRHRSRRAFAAGLRLGSADANRVNPVRRVRWS